MVKTLREYKWNKSYYALVELNSGAKVELKSAQPLSNADIEAWIARIEAEPDPQVEQEKREAVEFYAKLDDLVIAKPLEKDEKLEEWAGRVKADSLGVSS